MQKNVNGADYEKFSESMKTKIADDFNPSEAGLNNKFPLLKSAVEKVVKHLEAGTE
ncbi:hypothetical protein [Methanococcoides seepicolus]|uniref:Uncharacterized protein n=1 Tax=Methanococcoides seepicolus TaxID=2828780 RepID=A0A9E4ZGG1_9EURY|nr:hypothetical protein [Methanococcoides seepicolus]MCM1986464.1 hypothetical protein [Methanococcoides seepicolus]